jgi:hypothetical protein
VRNTDKNRLHVQSVPIHHVQSIEDSLPSSNVRIDHLPSSMRQQLLVTMVLDARLGEIHQD